MSLRKVAPIDIVCSLLWSVGQALLADTHDQSRTGPSRVKGASSTYEFSVSFDQPLSQCTAQAPEAACLICCTMIAVG